MVRVVFSQRFSSNVITKDPKDQQYTDLQYNTGGIILIPSSGAIMMAEDGLADGNYAKGLKKSIRFSFFTSAISATNETKCIKCTLV